MQRTFFYTQIKSNDFELLKESCKPFSKDIFSADQEHIVAFDQPSHACKAALKFLNKVYDSVTKHEYKIVLVNGQFVQDRPEELPVRVARTIHQNAPLKALTFSEDVLTSINMSDIVFEQKSPMFVKALQKEVPTYSLSRFEDTELQVDPTDLFDFSQVDSYSTVDSVRVSPDGEPIKPKDPFESSNTTIELDSPKKKISITTGKIQPAPHLAQNTPSQRVQTKPRIPEVPNAKTSPKSIAIILVLLVIVTFAGFYLAKSKSNPSVQTTTAEKTLPIPEIPSTDAQDTTTVSESADGTLETQAETTPAPVAKKTQSLVTPIAYLNIRSAPKGAEIWMNGKKLKSKTPLDNVKVSTKEQVKIDVVKPGYTKATKKLDLTPQETRTVMFQMTAAASPAPKLDPKAAALAKAKALSQKKKPAKKK